MVVLYRASECVNWYQRFKDGVWMFWCVQVAGNGHTHTNTQKLSRSVSLPSFLSLHGLEINLGWVSRQLTQQTKRLCVCAYVVGHSVSLLRGKGCRWPCRASLPLLSLPLASTKIKAACLFWAALNFEIYCFHVTLRKQKLDIGKPVLICMKELGPATHSQGF